MIMQAMSFTEFQDYKALLDMLEDDGYVGKPLPAYAENCRKVSLLDLYLSIKREGGHLRVTDNHMWVVITKDMGLDYNDGELM
ncbi:putative transcription factor & chromatin remodeling ARID family [Helianthus anomalus]